MCNGCLVTQQRFDSAGSYWVRSISRVEMVNETPFKQMKLAQQTYVDNKVLTIITCSQCGAKTKAKGSLTSKAVEDCLSRPCRTCNPPFIPHKEGWWKQFGLDSNPYVYGPMPRLRTSQRYRMIEARQMGWMAWTWNDEYQEERKRSS